MYYTKYACVAFLLAIICKTCLALKCHSCDTYLSSIDQKQCEDPWVEKYDSIEDCDDDHTHCMKLKSYSIRMDTELGGIAYKSVVTRSCVKQPEMKGNVCIPQSGSGSINFHCYCNSDGCNAAPSVHTSQISSLLIIAGVSLIIMRFL